MRTSHLITIIDHIRYLLHPIKTQNHLTKAADDCEIITQINWFSVFIHLYFNKQLQKGSKQSLQNKTLAVSEDAGGCEQCGASALVPDHAFSAAASSSPPLVLRV